MLRKLVLKKLKPTDLTFFKSYFTQNSQSKQKGFNLDAKVMQGQGLFPALRVLLEPLAKKATHVDLVLFGPGLAPPHSLARKVKIDAKNLRLNGELIHDPDDEPHRYEVLSEGDFAVMEFEGDALPTSVKVVLIGADSAEDQGLHSIFRRLLPDPEDSMIALEETVLQATIDEAAPHTHHPIRNWLDPVLLEEVGRGDAVAIEKVNELLPRQGITPENFRAIKEMATKTGELGEELLKQYFDSESLHGVASHEWVSQVNAVSPYDFLLNMHSGETRHADAKSTTGTFSTRLFLSTAEIRHALASGTPYDIYRLYKVKDGSATLRVARDVRPHLDTLKGLLDSFPKGVNVDSLSFDPAFFSFELAEIQIKLSTDA